MYFESEITVPIRQLLRSLLNLAEFFLKLPSLSPRRLSLSPGVQYLHLGELHDEDPSSAEISLPEIRERSKSIQVPYLSSTYLRGSARQITPDMCAEVTPPPRPGSAPWCSWADSFAHLKQQDLFMLCLSSTNFYHQQNPQLLLLIHIILVPVCNYSRAVETINLR